ncbi:MAG: acyclic terpene utilization AtuA family protein [bacterium]|nr:acyclic terpene utilization AtuA family protein [bacterium]
MRDIIRIANGQGFWGDSIDAPVHLVERGGIDFLTLDYLAEVTLSIMQRQRLKNPESGFARDFVELAARILPACLEKNIRVITNAGGVNPKACRTALEETAEHLGKWLRVGVVEGDDILDRLDDLIRQGADFRNMETGEPFESIRGRITSANVYIDSFCIAEALDQGAQIVLAGRVSDPGLALGPLIHAFGWQRDDWDLLAAGTVAGHITECGAQCTGGNYSRWWEVPDMARIGYPIVEAAANGRFAVTKHEGTGGLVNVRSITEQLLYEMGDPRNYISPDVRVDFTTLSLEQAGQDRVEVRGVRGAPATDTFKVSCSYLAGWKASSQLTVSGPRARKKAELAAQIIWDRLRRECCEYDETLTEFLGVNTCHPGIAPEQDAEEVVLRLSVRDHSRVKVNRFGKELAPLITNGPPGITGFAGGRPKAQEIIAFWPALIPKHLVKTRVTVE